MSFDNIQIDDLVIVEDLRTGKRTEAKVNTFIKGYLICSEGQFSLENGKAFPPYENSKVLLGKSDDQNQ